MTESAPPPVEQRLSATVLNLALQLALVTLLVVWSFAIIRPFIIPVLWAIILAVALNPVFLRMKRILGGRGGWAAALFAVLGVAVVAVPSFFIGRSLLDSARELESAVEAGTVVVPPPPARVQDWPVVGENVYEAWRLASENLQAAMAQLEPQLRAVGEWMVGFLAGVGGTVLVTCIAIVIAAVLLAYQEPASGMARAVTRRVQGQWDEDFVGLAGATIGSVAKGVLGVAVIQSALCALGLFLAGIPAAGLFTIAVLVAAIVQLPPILIMIPAIVWAFSNVGTAVAVVFTVWSVLASMSDTPLKAVFLGRGVSLPMPVILVGAIGGMITMGMMGLFLGAVVLGIAYKLFQVWLGVGSFPEEPKEEVTSG